MKAEAPDPARVLRRRAPFDVLSEAGFAKLARALRPRQVRARESLLSRGDRTSALLVVASGSFKVGRAGESGREQILYVARAGKTIAEAALDLDGEEARSPVAVVALEPSRAWSLARADLDSLLGSEPAFARALVSLLARRVASLVDLLEDVALRDVPSRLAAFLYSDARRAGATSGPFRIARTLAVETVAGRLGTVREEVQRALRRLADEGLIDLSRREITVRDVAGLRRAAFASPVG